MKQTKLTNTDLIVYGSAFMFMAFIFGIVFGASL